MRKRIWGILTLLMILAVCAACPAGAEETLFRGADDLNRAGIRIGCIAGAPDEEMTLTLFPNAECVYANGNVDRAMMLDIGRIDGSIFYDSSAKSVLAQYPSLVAFPEPVKTSRCAFSAARTDKGEKAVSQFNAFLRELRESGAYDELKAKWLSAEETDAVMPEFSYAGESGALDLAIDPSVFPYSYIQNGKPAGLYIELANRFCEANGYTPQYHESRTPPRWRG